MEAALAAGDGVVAGARKPQELAELASQHGRSFCAVKHDVLNEAEGQVAVQTAMRQFGRLDVVVNNAGYSGSLPSSK